MFRNPFTSDLKRMRRDLARAEKRSHLFIVEELRRDVTGDLTIAVDNAAYEYETLENNYSVARSFELTTKARELELPVPESEYWDSISETGEMFLTEEGVAQLRSSIWQELKERREVWFRWGTLVVGVLGAITGLLAVALTLTVTLTRN